MTTKALRHPSSVPTRPNRNDSDAPIVNELVYHAAMRARRPVDTMRESLQTGHVHAGHCDAGRGPKAERRKQTVAKCHAEIGQSVERARDEIDASGGLAIGQADERDDGEHISGRHHSGEPSGLCIGQRPSLDELRQKRRDNRVSKDAEDFGAAHRSNDCCRRSSRGGASRTHRVPVSLDAGSIVAAPVFDRNGEWVSSVSGMTDGGDHLISGFTP